MLDVCKAVILAAGLGGRLKPITNNVPKCLTEINGKSILWHILQSLNSCGINDVTIVIGFQGQKIIDCFGSQFGKITITYRWNEKYAETNTMYSAWIAGDIIKEGSLLIEGDIIISESFLKLAVLMVKHTDKVKSYLMVDKFGPESNGSMAITNKEGRIEELRIVRDKLDHYPSNYFKSTGILRFTPEYGTQFVKWLSGEVENGNVNIYYDLVIAKHLKEIPIFIQYVGDRLWAEIDDIQDLKRAEQIFRQEKSEEYARSERHLIKQFWDERAAMIKRNEVSIFQSTMLTSTREEAEEKFYNERQALLKLILPLLSPQATMLELGCGSGRITRVLSQYVGRIDAYDYCQDYITIAKKVTKEAININYYCKSAEEVPKEKKYDLILLVGLLVYLNEKQFNSVMDLVSYSVREGGYIILREVCGTEKRFELHSFYSSVLGTEYYGIYRMAEELIKYLGNQFTLITNEVTLNPTPDKPETCQRVIILQKKVRL